MENDMLAFWGFLSALMDGLEGNPGPPTVMLVC